MPTEYEQSEELVRIIRSELYPDASAEQVARIVANRIRLSDWLAQVRREAAADALEDLGEYAERFTGEPAHYYSRAVVLKDGNRSEPWISLPEWLRARASEIREGGE